MEPDTVAYWASCLLASGDDAREELSKHLPRQDITEWSIDRVNTHLAELAASSISRLVAGPSQLPDVENDMSKLAVKVEVVMLDYYQRASAILKKLNKRNELIVEDPHQGRISLLCSGIVDHEPKYHRPCLKEDEKDVLDVLKKEVQTVELLTQKIVARLEDRTLDNPMETTVNDLGLHAYFMNVEEYYYGKGGGKSECHQGTTLRAALNLMGLGDITQQMVRDAKRGWDKRDDEESYNENTFARKILAGLMAIMINVEVWGAADGPLPIQFAFDTSVSGVDDARGKMKRGDVIGVDIDGDLVVVGEEKLMEGTNRTSIVAVERYIGNQSDAIKIGRIAHDAANMEKRGDVTQCRTHHTRFLPTYQIFKSGMFIDLFCRIGDGLECRVQMNESAEGRLNVVPRMLAIRLLIAAECAEKLKRNGCVDCQKGADDSFHTSLTPVSKTAKKREDDKKAAAKNKSTRTPQSSSGGGNARQKRGGSTFGGLCDDDNDDDDSDGDDDYHVDGDGDNDSDSDNDDGANVDKHHHHHHDNDDNHHDDSFSHCHADKYIFGDQLSRKGDVFEGTRRADSLAVVLKVIESPTELKMLRRANQLPGVVRLLDSFINEEGKIVMVMECLSPVPRNLPIKDLQVMLGRLAVTVGDLSRRLGIVHNDLHRGNVLLCPVTKELKLIDFGSAGFVGDEPYAKPIVGYCPPELLSNGARRLLATTDSFSFGHLVAQLTELEEDLSRHSSSRRYRSPLFPLHHRKVIVVATVLTQTIPAMRRSIYDVAEYLCPSLPTRDVKKEYHHPQHHHHHHHHHHQQQQNQNQHQQQHQQQ